MFFLTPTRAHQLVCLKTHTGRQSDIHTLACLHNSESALRLGEWLFSGKGAKLHHFAASKSSDHKRFYSCQVLVLLSSSYSSNTVTFCLIRMRMINKTLQLNLSATNAGQFQFCLVKVIRDELGYTTVELIVMNWILTVRIRCLKSNVCSFETTVVLYQ